ncbi:MAG: restriction endonuclease subunit S, partial [Mariprofundaceae bacterium]
MSHYKPYPAYKPSGVEWLGDVPAHWEVKPPKRLIEAAAGGAAIKGKTPREGEGKLFPAFSASGQDVWLHEWHYDSAGIVLSAVGARCGKTFKADGKWGVVANTHCLFPKKNADRDFLWYLTNQETWWEKGGTAQPFVKVSATLDRKWAFPPTPAEQSAIADFLDRETGRIDALVEKKRRFIELLKEKRQALITAAVTGKFDVRTGKPYPAYKPSGVEWLADVPEHWNIQKLRWLASFRSGESITSERIEDIGPYPVYGGNGLRGFTSSYTHEGTHILIGRQGAQCGNIHYSTDKRFWASEHAVVVTPYKTLRVVWLGSVLKAMNLNQYSVSAAQPGLAVDRVMDLMVAEPPFKEQSAIADFLDRETGRIDALI